MPYYEVKPAPLLKKYIDAYWHYEHTDDTTQNYDVLPDGCMDIIFDFGARTIVAYGATPTSQTHRLVPHQMLFGIRFMPGILAQLVGVSASTLREKIVPLEGIDIELHTELTGLFDLHGSREYAKFCNEKLGYAISLRDKVMRLAAADTHTNALTVDELARQSRVSVRHLQRLFRDRVGVTPKQYLKIMRFNRARHLLDDSEKTLATCADELGYSDQAHMTKDIKQLAATTPKRMRMARLYKNSSSE